MNTQPHGHGHHHHHHHHGRGPATRFWLRGLLAAAVVGLAVLCACLRIVDPGAALVVTRLGDPVRVLSRPGPYWTLPPPLDSTIPVDLRMHTTSGGLQDVGTSEGLRVLAQAYLVWQVDPAAAHVTQFVRALRNDPDEAGVQVRSAIASAIETIAGGFALADLVNTNPRRIRLDRFQAQLADRLGPTLLQLYGIHVRQVGLERLMLPTEAMDATIDRMRAERQTVAAERTAQGERVAAALRADADRAARITVADARADAAALQAKARLQAADIDQQAYRSDPALYILLRSLDTLDSVIGPNARLVLRTDAAPFRVLVDGPAAPDESAPPQPRP